MGKFYKGPSAVLIGGVAGGVALVMGVFLVAGWYFYRRRKGLTLLPTTDSMTGLPTKQWARPSYTPSGLGPISISRSYPDIHKSSSSSSSSAGTGSPSSTVGPSGKKNMIQIADRQWTLPTVSQRHQNFQRMLSHRLNLSNIEFTVQSNVRQCREQPELGGLKPELYKQASVDSLRSEHQAPCGKLFFTLTYNQEESTLIVHICKAENLPAKDFSGTSDPYVKVYLLPDRKTKLQTKVHRKTLNPEFMEKFRFSVPYDELSQRALQFNIYDFDRFSRHDVIGAVLVKDILVEGSLANETSFVRDIYASTQEKADIGEVMLSLCYLPTAGRLTLTVVKARNLKAMDITGYADPYVKVCLMCQGRRIKKRKTSVQRNTLNPVFNEALVFDVPQENVEDVYLLVKLVDYDRIGSDELMGVVTMGPRMSGQGREHWFEMLESPRKPVAQWYSLLEHSPLPVNGNGNGKCCLRQRQSTEDSTHSDGLP